MVYKKMNAKHKKTWIKALTSGKYKQATGSLIRRDVYAQGKKVVSYCCLGVAERVCLGKRTNNIYGGSLCETSMNKLGLTEPAHAKLVNLNDNRGKDFKEIAKWIEKNL